MKALIPILVFTFFTVLISCGTDDIVSQEDTINSSDLTITTTQTETIENNHTRGFLGVNGPISPEAAALEHTMQWIAYTTTSVIYYDTAAKDQFLNRINYNPLTNYSDPTIDIKDLIGDTILDTDVFKIAFRDHLIQIFSSHYDVIATTGTCPIGPSEAPEPPLDSGTGGNGSPVIPGGPSHFIQSRSNIIPPSQIEIENMVDAFIAYILSDECIEIYLPIGITQTFTEITSAGHPMSAATINSGYHTFLFETCQIFVPATDNVNVNQGYANNANGPIIIARPKKSRECLYTSYNFDFTAFLD